jgi:hypothetical protein
VCRIILTYETAAARSVVSQKRGFPAHFVIRQGLALRQGLVDRNQDGSLCSALASIRGAPHRHASERTFTPDAILDERGLGDKTEHKPARSRQTIPAKAV